MSGRVGDVAERVTSLGSVVCPGQPIDKGKKHINADFLSHLLCGQWGVRVKQTPIAATFLSVVEDFGQLQLHLDQC